MAVGYADLWAALTRPRVLALGGLYFLMVTGLYGIGFWMPQVIGGFGLDPLSVGFLTAIPYLFAAAAIVMMKPRTSGAVAGQHGAWRRAIYSMA